MTTRGLDQARRALSGFLVKSVLPDDGRDHADVLFDNSVVDVVAAADMHRVAPAVFRSIRSIDAAPAEWVAALGHLRHEQLMRHLRAVQDLARAGSVLDAADIAWVTVKGPTLSELIWPRPDMRQYLDLDLIVDRRRFEDALRVLSEAGCSLVDRNWPLLRSTMRAELAMRAVHGTPLDLHWDIAVPKNLRRAFRSDIDGMLNRSRRTDLSGAPNVSVLDPVDTVLHLLFHTAQAGASRLVWLADIRFAAGQPGFDWLELAWRARAMRFEIPAAMLVARVERTLGFDSPPPSVVTAPAGGIWGRLAARRDERAPFPGLPGDRHIGGSIYSGARRGLVKSAATTVNSHVLTKRIERRMESDDSNDERILYRDVPDEQAKLGYFAIAEYAANP